MKMVCSAVAWDTNMDDKVNTSHMTFTGNTCILQRLVGGNRTDHLFKETLQLSYTDSRFPVLDNK